MMNDKISRGLELTKVAVSYRETGDDRYFEELWEQVKPFAFMQGKKYNNTIDKREMEQAALICLYDCCRCIKEGANLLTYYGRILVNRYHDLYRKPTKRGNDKLNTEALSLDITYDTNDNNYLVFNPSTEDDIFFIEDFYEECRLAENEVLLVDLLNIGYKQTEIMEKLHLEKNEYKRLLKGIRKKVLNNYDFGAIR